MRLFLDPNFVRSVVLLCEHTPDAAMGVILNRPTALEAIDAVPVLEPLVPALERIVRAEQQVGRASDMGDGAGPGAADVAQGPGYGVGGGDAAFGDAGREAAACA